MTWDSNAAAAAFTLCPKYCTLTQPHGEMGGAEEATASELDTEGLEYLDLYLAEYVLIILPS